MRTVPVVLGIADRVRELARPDAWIVDFTNPVGIVTRALLDAGHRAIGLCNVAIGVQREIARLLGIAPERVLVDHVGLNHLTWVRRVLVDGSDVLPELLETHGEALARHAGLPLRLLEELGAVPSSYTSATSTPTTSSSPSSAQASHGRSRSARSRRASSTSTATPRSRTSLRFSSSAEARSTARPRRR